MELLKFASEDEVYAYDRAIVKHTIESRMPLYREISLVDNIIEIPMLPFVTCRNSGVLFREFHIETYTEKLAALGYDERTVVNIWYRGRIKYHPAAELSSKEFNEFYIGRPYNINVWSREINVMCNKSRRPLGTSRSSDAFKFAIVRESSPYPDSIASVAQTEMEISKYLESIFGRFIATDRGQSWLTLTSLS